VGGDRIKKKKWGMEGGNFVEWKLGFFWVVKKIYLKSFYSRLQQRGERVLGGKQGGMGEKKTHPL